MQTRALPTVIGPTESALRAVLHSVLAGSSITSYEAWVALNLADAPIDGPLEDRIAKSLQSTAEEADTLLAQLAERGLLTQADDGWCLTAEGVRVRDPLRRRVGELTARLIEGIDATEMSTAVAVLDRVRARALDELARA